MLHDRDLMADDETGAEIIRLLVEAGGDVGFKDDNDDTPLHVACYWKGAAAPITALLSTGAPVNDFNSHGNAPLHTAGFCDEGRDFWRLDQYREFGDPIPKEDLQPPGRFWGAAELVEMMVRYGANPNLVNPQNGYTPMHTAYWDYPYRSLLRALFRHGGNPGIRNRDGLRAADFYPMSHPGGDLALLTEFAEVVSPPPKFLKYARERVKEVESQGGDRKRTKWID